MEDHVFLEIAEGSICLTQARVGRKQVHIGSRALLELPSHDSSSIIFGVHDVLRKVEKAGKRALTVHVAISDNRFLHFGFELPRMPSLQMTTLLKREARRIGRMPGTEDVLLGYRSLGKVSGGKLRLSVVAIRESALRPVLEEIQLEGFTIGTVTSLAEASLRQLPSEVLSSAILVDSDLRRLSFISVEEGVVSLRRQVYLDDVDEGVDDQLPRDLSRFMKSLEEMNKRAPEVLVLGPRIPLSEELGKALRSRLRILQIAEFPHGQSREAHATGLATCGLIRSVQARKGLTVSGRPRRTAPHKRVALCGLVCVMAMVLGIALTRNSSLQRSQLEDLARTVTKSVAWNKDKEELLRHRVTEKEHADLGPLASSVFNSRRPVSLFVGQLSRVVPDGIVLQSLHVRRDGTIELRGAVDAPGNVQTLAIIRLLRDRLRAFAYLQGVYESINEFRSGSGPVQFSVKARWNPESK